MTEVATGEPALDEQLEAHRIELTAYCYRMLGSAFEAEDAVQDTMVRAWRGHARFEGRASLRSWLYRIATNVCFDLLDGRQRWARPMDLGPAQSADTALGAPLPEQHWIQPVPDGRVLPETGDPAEVAELRDTVRLAFVAALHHLPPRQRAVLILREVLRWPASEVATLLDTSVASVNSALQRARATLGELDVDGRRDAPALNEESKALLTRYVDAFERYDMAALTALLREDATWSMPPFELWLRGHEDIAAFCRGTGAACAGSRLVATTANGSPAYGQYKPSPDGGFEPWSLQVLEVEDGEITGIVFYLDTPTYFPQFGLPPRLDD